MGLRFRRRVKICPGLYLNFSTGGMSVTGGIPGASINVGPKGAYLNAGIPGTGIYSRQKISTNDDVPLPPEPALELPSANVREIKSDDVENLTSMEFSETKQMILKAYRDRRDFRAKIAGAKSKLSWLNAMNIVSKFCLVGLVFDLFNSQVECQKELIRELEALLVDSDINLNVAFDEKTEKAYREFELAYERMSRAAIKWDKTSTMAADQFGERTSATSTISRSPVAFDFEGLEVLKSKQRPFHLENSNGPDIYIYPAFIVVKRNDEVGVLGFKEVEFVFSGNKFIEEESVPRDSKQIGATWKKTNKDGGPDRRFKGNFQIPIVLYGEFSFRSGTGLNETFIVSDYESSYAFAALFQAYQKIMVMSKA